MPIKTGNPAQEFDMEQHQREFQKIIDSQNPATNKKTTTNQSEGPFHVEKEDK